MNWKKHNWITPLLVMGGVLFLIISCGKDEENDNTTTGQLPSLTTAVVSDIAQTSASGGGDILLDGGSTITARGVCWSTATTPYITDSKTTDGSGLGGFTSTISGLTANTTYNVRAYATNSTGTGYGPAVTFTTLQSSSQIPIVTTGTISGITQTSATCVGLVSGDGGYAVTVRGVCWSTNQDPMVTGNHTVDGTGTGSFGTLITGLTANTLYYVRAYATNSQGTGYGNNVSFTTGQAGATVTDYDGNVYNTVAIGSQVWMGKNLNVTHYRNGDPIPNVTDAAEWIILSTGAWCEYNNLPANGITYGKMYNWFAAIDYRGICPTGWHLPSDAEWTTLTTYIGTGTNFEGGMLKEVGTTHWASPNTGASDDYGFTALPGGIRYNDGDFNWLGTVASFWSSTEYDATTAWTRYLRNDISSVLRLYKNKFNGMSIRCLHD